MPILYIHGVNVRSRDGSRAIVPYLRRLVAPAISKDPENVWIDDVYWGDLGVQFAWNGASRPRSQLLGMGAGGAAPHEPVSRALAFSAFAAPLQALPAEAAAAPASGGLIAGGSTPRPADTIKVDLRPWNDDQLADFLAAVITQTVPDSPQRAELILAADALVREPALRAALQACEPGDQQVQLLRSELDRIAPSPSGLVGMGAGSWFAGVWDRVSETVSRGLSLPAHAASVVLAELRKPLNDLISVFIGDVFQYLIHRGTAAMPGEIPRRLLEKLEQAHVNKQQRGGEPLVVLSHSMGGQIVYDAITHLLPQTPNLAGLRVEFWCATASQVGFFEEAKLFFASDAQHKTGHPVPFPDSHLGAWWNVWDPNDVLSFTARDMFLGVDDEAYESGMSLLVAHGGYLDRPSFYRNFATKLRQAAQRGWRTV